MKKVNLEKQISKLFDNCITDIALETLEEESFTDGVMIKKDKMSKYLKESFKKSIELENVPNGRLNYLYYLDEINKICVLFTEPWIENIDNQNEVALKADAILVQMYLSESDFMGSILWQYYHFNIVVPGTDKWWWHEGYYYTDCKKYNNLPFVKAIMRISDRLEIIRQNTLDDIINSK